MLGTNRNQIVESQTPKALNAIAMFIQGQKMSTGAILKMDPRVQIPDCKM